MSKSSREKSKNLRKKSTYRPASWPEVKRALRAIPTGKTGKIPLRSKPAEDPPHYLPSTALFKRVYDYAYQVGNELDRVLFDETHLREASDYQTAGEEVSKDRIPGSGALFRVWYEAWIRFRYQEGLSLRYDDFAWLAYLTNDADAAFLSLEELIEVSDLSDIEGNVDAWLKRHGFRPTLLPEDIGIPHAPMIEALLRTASFSKAIARANYLTRDSITKMAAKSNVDKEWLRGLIKGEQVAVDVEALQRVATYFGVDADLFVGRAVRAIYRAG